MTVHSAPHSTPPAGDASGDGAQGPQERRSRPCHCRPVHPPPKGLDILASCHAALPRTSLRARRAQDAEGGRRRHPHSEGRIGNDAEGGLIACWGAATAPALVDPSDPSRSWWRRGRLAGGLRGQVPKLQPTTLAPEHRTPNPKPRALTLRPLHSTPRSPGGFVDIADVVQTLNQRARQVQAENMRLKAMLLGAEDAHATEVGPSPCPLHPYPKSM